MQQVTEQNGAPAGGVDRSELLGVAFDAMTEEACVRHVLDSLANGCGGWIVTANLDHLRRLVMERDYARLCAGADLIVADGAPLVWASRIAGTPLPERVAGSNLVCSLSAGAAKENRSVFLLGGDPGTAREASRELSRSCVGLRVAGTYCPPMGFERDPLQMATIRRLLIDRRPDVIYLGLGSPKQERLITQLRHCAPNAWWIGVGVSFSFLCGRVHRAPLWLQRMGLEWFHRMVQEPERLVQRYLVDGLPFSLKLFSKAVTRRFAGRRPEGTGKGA